MNRKIWLVIFLLGSLILLLGGMHKPERPAGNDSADPMVEHAETAVSHAVDGPQSEWRKAARGNPQWILQLEAVED